MTQFNTDITLDIRGHEFKIEIYGDVDRDGCAENIEMFWQNFKPNSKKTYHSVFAHTSKKNTATK